MCHVSLSVKGKIPAYSRLILTLPQTDTAIAVNMSLTAVSPPEIPTRTVVMMKIFSVLISVSEMRYDGDVNKCLDKRLCRQRSERHTQTNTRGDSFVCLFCRFWMFSCECWGVLGASWGQMGRRRTRREGEVCMRACLFRFVRVCLCLFVWLCLFVFVCVFACVCWFVHMCRLFLCLECLFDCLFLFVFVRVYVFFLCFFKCVRLCMRAVCFILGMRVCLCVCLYLFLTPIICFYNYCVCVCCLCGLMCLFVCWLVCVFVCLCLCECFCQFVSHLMQFVQFVSLFHCLMDLLSLAVFVLK